MSKYLYGFTTHSIQGYIFQTNKLKEIAGASELVEQICTEKFAQMVKSNNLQEDDNAIRFAAGNIRYLFEDDKQCKEVVLKFPKQVLKIAPGILFSQAVVACEDEPNIQDFLKLEKRLNDQRNNPIRPVDLGFIAINRSRLTGLPSVERKKSLGEILINDQATKCKQDIIDDYKRGKMQSRVNQAFFGNDIIDNKVPIDFEEIVATKSKDYCWLAVVHADGNNMGLALQNLEKVITEEKNYGMVSRQFSQAIDQATKAAAQKSFQYMKASENLNEIDLIPFRPIIVGGDDLTLVCRADLAMKFTQVYLEEFEKQTKVKFEEAGLSILKNGLTACAGISFVKVTYPFHYAINLAETLCAHAKKDAKKKLTDNGLTPSCLMFHKVQDSFVEKFENITERELTAKDSAYRFDFGPYYTNAHETDHTIKNLLDHLAKFQGKEGNAIKTHLRNWLSELHTNKGHAEQLMKRLLSVGNQSILNDLGLKTNKGIIADKSPVYDWLTILSINQNTNTNDEH